MKTLDQCLLWCEEKQASACGYYAKPPTLRRLTSSRTDCVSHARRPEVFSVALATHLDHTYNMKCAIFHGRSVRNLSKAEDQLKNFNPIDFHASKFKSFINSEKFGFKQPIGKWLAKVATIVAGGGLACGIAFGLVHNILKLVLGITVDTVSLYVSLFSTELGLVHAALVSLWFTDIYGYWKVKSARKAYLIMVVIDVVAYGLYGWLVRQNFIQTERSLLWSILSIAAECALFVVYGFNWYKVLYPAWTGFGDW